MYKDEPILQWPYQLLTVLCEVDQRPDPNPTSSTLILNLIRIGQVDEMMGNFRHRHAQMVHRMIGMKPGTGGQSRQHCSLGQGIN